MKCKWSLGIWLICSICIRKLFNDLLNESFFWNIISFCQVTCGSRLLKNKTSSLFSRACSIHSTFLFSISIIASLYFIFMEVLFCEIPNLYRSSVHLGSSIACCFSFSSPSSLPGIKFPFVFSYTSDSLTVLILN